MTSVFVTFIVGHASDGKLYVHDMLGIKKNKDIAKAIFREEASGRNNKAASDVLDDGILTQNALGVKIHSDRDPDSGNLRWYCVHPGKRGSGGTAVNERRCI